MVNVWLRMVGNEQRTSDEAVHTARFLGTGSLAITTVETIDTTCMSADLNIRACKAISRLSSVFQYVQA